MYFRLERSLASESPPILFYEVRHWYMLLCVAGLMSILCLMLCLFFVLARDLLSHLEMIQQAHSRDQNLLLSGLREERIRSSESQSSIGLERESVPRIILEIILDLIRRGVIKLDDSSVTGVSDDVYPY